MVRGRLYTKLLRKHKFILLILKVHPYLIITYISLFCVEDEPSQLPVAYNLSSLVEPPLADVGRLLWYTPPNIERGGGVANSVTFLGKLNVIFLLERSEYEKLYRIARKFRGVKLSRMDLQRMFRDLILED